MWWANEGYLLSWPNKSGNKWNYSCAHSYRRRPSTVITTFTLQSSVDICINARRRWFWGPWAVLFLRHVVRNDFVCLLTDFTVYTEKNNEPAKAGVYFRFLCCSLVKDLRAFGTLHNIKSKNKVWNCSFLIQYTPFVPITRWKYIWLLKRVLWLPNFCLC